MQQQQDDCAILGFRGIRFECVVQSVMEKVKRLVGAMEYCFVFRKCGISENLSRHTLCLVLGKYEAQHREIDTCILVVSAKNEYVVSCISYTILSTSFGPARSWYCTSTSVVFVISVIFRVCSTLSSLPPCPPTTPEWLFIPPPPPPIPPPPFSARPGNAIVIVCACLSSVGSRRRGTGCSACRSSLGSKLRYGLRLLEPVIL